MKMNILAACRSLGRTACAGAVLLVAASGSAQDLFVSLLGSGNILEITPDGTQSTFLSSSYPWGLASDGAGDLYQAGDGGSACEFVNNNGTLSSSPNVLASGLPNPEGIAVNSSGDVFVSQPYEGGNVVTEITPGGVQSTFASGLDWPEGLAFNKAGNLFVGDIMDGNIYEYTPSGNQSLFASGVWDAFAMAFNSAGDLFVAQNNDILEITPNRTQTIFASLDNPEGIAINSAGDVFATECVDNGDVVEITPNGTQTIIASGLDEPLGLAFAAPEPSTFSLGGLALGVIVVARKLHGRQRQNS